ncbi:MAG: hypothetical protein Q4B96_05405 [Bacillota bacterium]|nr:hypothetical protein [Bacillota bacterium]
MRKIKKFVYGASIVLFLLIGYLLMYYLLGPYILQYGATVYWVSMVFAGLMMLALGSLVAPLIIRGIEKITDSAVSQTTKLSYPEIVSCAIGLIAGLIIASLIGNALSGIAIIGTYLSLFCLLLFGYIGLMIGYRRRSDIVQLVALRGRNERIDRSVEKSADKRKDKGGDRVTPKILDTSVVIDGRIADIYHTGFIEGDLIVAKFVLDELQHIADSSDMLKRNRGRSGLDILNRMRKEFPERVIISEKDYADITEVDSKLLKLAQELGGVVVTNDFNLNKVAQLQNVNVLNINELSNAVKPIVLPGEEMLALVIKEGKEANQGVAYLDDGTMIVVENGRKYVGRQIRVIVTSILQTSAGRMVFAKPKLGKNGEVVEN